MSKDAAVSSADLLVYQNADGGLTLPVKLREESIWLSQTEIARLFSVQKSAISKHILGALQQTVDAKETSLSVAENAAHLLYSLTKDHPFVDGNKRIAAFLFIVYLTRTEHVTARDGERKFTDSALVALVLLIAESKPEQKSLLVKLITNFVHGS